MPTTSCVGQRGPTGPQGPGEKGRREDNVGTPHLFRRLHATVLDPNGRADLFVLVRDEIERLLHHERRQTVGVEDEIAPGSILIPQNCHYALGISFFRLATKQ